MLINVNAWIYNCNWPIADYNSSVNLFQLCQPQSSCSSRGLSLAVYRAASSHPSSTMLTHTSDLLKRSTVLVCFSQLKLITRSISSSSQLHCTVKGTLSGLWCPLFLPSAARAGSFIITVERSRQSLALLQVQVSAGVTPSDASSQKWTEVRHWGICAV